MAVEQVGEEGFKVPAHVPQHLIQDIDLFAYLNDAGHDIWQRIADSHSSMPRIFWARRFGMLPGMWVATRGADLRKIMQDYETFSSRDLTVYSKLVGESWKQLPLEADPPLHTKYRAPLNPLFSPKRVMGLEESVRSTAVKLIDGFAARGHCDFNAEFAQIFPIEIFLRMMGWPVEEAPTFTQWANALLKSSSASEAIPPLRNILAYLRAQIAERRKNPSDDFTSLVLQMAVDGRPYNEDEVIGTVFLIFLGGLDTVTSSLGHQYYFLAKHPEMQAWLREDSSRVTLAVEELLRARSVVSTRRLVTKDVEFGGILMKAGDHVLCPTPFANLDPTEFACPVDVQLDRADNRHVAFSYGPHRCLGSHLARREMSIAMDEWLKRIPTFRVANDCTPTIQMGPVIGIKDLKLEWETGAPNRGK